MASLNTKQPKLYQDQHGLGEAIRQQLEGVKTAMEQAEKAQRAVDAMSRYKQQMVDRMMDMAINPAPSRLATTDWSKAHMGDHNHQFTQRFNTYAKPAPSGFQVGQRAKVLHYHVGNGSRLDVTGTVAKITPTSVGDVLELNVDPKFTHVARSITSYACHCVQVLPTVPARVNPREWISVDNDPSLPQDSLPEAPHPFDIQAQERRSLDRWSHVMGARVRVWKGLFEGAEGDIIEELFINGRKAVTVKFREERRGQWRAILWPEELQPAVLSRPARRPKEGSLKGPFS